MPVQINFSGDHFDVVPIANGIVLSSGRQVDVSSLFVGPTGNKKKILDASNSSNTAPAPTPPTSNNAPQAASNSPAPRYARDVSEVGDGVWDFIVTPNDHIATITVDLLRGGRFL